MGREIRFRAWDLRCKKMKLVWAMDYKHNDENYVMIQTPHSEFPSNPAEWGNTKEHIVLMQYTGLKDKNGKEMFEGDIIKFNYDCLHCTHELSGSISYHKGFGGFSISTEDSDIGMGFLNLEDPEFEIIGNVWENPNLLKD